MAFAGPISFVGIAVPHIVKSVLKSTKPIYMNTGLLPWGSGVLPVL